MLIGTRQIGEQLVNNRGQHGTNGAASAAARVDPLVESLASDLADVAYQVALRHGLGGDWLELQLDLWNSLTAALEKRSWSAKEIELPYDPRLDVD